MAAVAQATAVLLERVSSMDGEVGALVESLRAGAGRLAGDLAARRDEHGRALRRRVRVASPDRPVRPQRRDGGRADTITVAALDPTLQPRRRRRRRRNLRRRPASAVETGVPRVRTATSTAPG